MIRLVKTKEYITLDIGEIKHLLQFRVISGHGLRDHSVGVLIDDGWRAWRGELSSSCGCKEMWVRGRFYRWSGGNAVEWVEGIPVWLWGVNRRFSTNSSWPGRRQRAGGRGPGCTRAWLMRASWGVRCSVLVWVVLVISMLWNWNTSMVWDDGGRECAGWGVDSSADIGCKGITRTQQEKIYVIQDFSVKKSLNLSFNLFLLFGTREGSVTRLLWYMGVYSCFCSDKEILEVANLKRFKDINRTKYTPKSGGCWQHTIFTEKELYDIFLPPHNYGHVNITTCFK